MTLPPNAVYTLEDASGVAINNMNADWTSKAYDMIHHKHLCVHLFWSSIAPTGTMTLEYTGDPIQDDVAAPVNWVAKDVTNVDGTFQEIMYLDANLPIAAFRLRFEHISGSAVLSNAFIVKKV